METAKKVRSLWSVILMGVMGLSTGMAQADLIFEPNEYVVTIALDEVYCPRGDLNGDCIVDLLDLKLFLSKWPNNPEQSDADFNGDLRINLSDYNILAKNWLQKKSLLMINEFLARNNTIEPPDPNGQYDDWIELYNAGDKPIDVGGIYLTDDLDAPLSQWWQFPTDQPEITTIQPHGYLLIWADEDTTDTPGLHASFQLEADNGEDVGLYDSDGITLLDSISFGKQYSDISFGRYPNGSNNWRYLGAPTPGALNDGAYLGIVADTTFSVDRGFYDTSFAVEITCATEGATIYYTINGSAPIEPNDNPAATSQEYSVPVEITQTTCLRAAAVKAGWKSTNIDTHTYIFLEDVIASDVMNTAITQDPIYGPQMRDVLTDLPTISIATPPGILEPYLPGPGPYPEWTYDEVPASVEWIMPDGSDGFQENSGVARFGGHWYDKPGSYRPYDKWSFRIYFRGEYGATKLRFPLFEGYDHGISPVEVFDQLELHSGSHDMSQRGFYMSSSLTCDTMLEMGNLNPHGRFVHVYINGVYWGKYFLRERWNADMHAQYLGGEKEDYEGIKTHVNVGGWNDMGEPYDGDGSAWENVLSLRDSYEAIKPYLDVQNYIDFMLMWMFGRSEAEYRCVGPVGPGTGFKFWLNDADGFTADRSPWDDNDGPGWIFKSLNEESHADYKILLADRIHKHLFNNGDLTQVRMTARLMERCNQIERAFIAETARWGYLTPTTWAGKRDSYINNVLSSRTAELLNQLKGAGFYPATDAPVFNINGSYQHDGPVEKNAIFSITQPTLYIDITYVDEYVPVRAHVPTDNSLGLTWTENSFSPDSTWTDGTTTTGVGYERGSGYGDWIHTDVEAYMFEGSTSVFCRIEFENDGLETPEELYLHMKYDDGFIAYLNGGVVELTRSNNINNEIPGFASAGSHEAGQAYDIFDVTDKMSRLQTGTNVLAIHGINISQTSTDMIVLPKLIGKVPAGENPLDDVWYTTNGGDPRLPGGATNPNAMEYTDSFPLTKSTKIKARTYGNGQWSALNEAVYSVGPVAQKLRITELMYHPADPTSGPYTDEDFEFIELKHVGDLGDDPINLNLVSFTNGIDYTFDSTVILEPNDYIVVVKNQAAFATRYNNAGMNLAPGQYIGSLDNGGEEIDLKDALGAEIHDFDYNDGWYEITDGLGFSLTIRDPNSSDPNDWDRKSGWRASFADGGSPGEDDSAFVLPDDAVIVNELLAHADTLEPNDWVEFYNTTDEPINIGGWFISDNDNDLMKYEIEESFIIPSHGYTVFDADPNFGPGSSDPGSHTGFAFSENGEKIYLTSGSGGELTGVYSDEEDFGPSSPDVAFGRYYNSGTDSYNFVAMDHNTEGAANVDPKVWDVVINEIMYNPDPNVNDSYDHDEYEYIELYNRTGSAVDLQEWDNEESIYVPWRFTRGILYSFPLGATIPAYGYIVVVKNLAAFSERHPTVPAGKIYGPFESGNLKNGGEKLDLGIPGDKVGIERMYIRIDRLDYSDGDHDEDFPGGVDPWPTEPDGDNGDGSSLKRKVAGDYGNDVDNWQAGSPTPGL